MSVEESGMAVNDWSDEEILDGGAFVPAIRAELKRRLQVLRSEVADLKEKNKSLKSDIKDELNLL